MWLKVISNASLKVMKALNMKIQPKLKVEEDVEK
jgi:hypothetical protein